MNLNFVQLNIRNFENDKAFLQELQLDINNYILGLEITNSEYQKLIINNIDPQHVPHYEDNEYTCVEQIFYNLESFDCIRDKNIYVCLFKTDLDSISAAALIDLFLRNKLILTEEIINRILAIANYDRHSREYEKRNINQYSKVKIPKGLFLFVSGWQNTLIEKIDAVKTWLTTGLFHNMEYYNELATQNFQESIQNSRIEILKNHNIAFVKSIKRGACGLGYQVAPVVVAVNPSYRFGFGEDRIYGKKWTVAQCNNQFIDLERILFELNKYECGWNGSETIIGSPQDRPSRIRKHTLLNIIIRNKKEDMLVEE